MRVSLWTAGLVIAAMGIQGALAADYDGPYRHRHWRGHNFRAVIGTCVRTRVAAIGTGPAGPGAIRYRDGVVQEYDGGMLGHVETRPGDPIQLCLVSFSRDCGEDELPGRTYATGNLRTGAAWTLPDIRSSCSIR
jgi:hypothetical protein